MASRPISSLAVFYDANVFMDVLFVRQGWENSAKVLNAAKIGQVQKGCVSALSTAIIYFLLRGSKGKRRISDSKARSGAQNSIHGLEVLALSAQNIASSMGDKRFTDFEDAIQFHCAREGGRHSHSKQKGFLQSG